LKKGRVKLNAVRLRTNERRMWEERENVSLHRKENMREVVLACNFPIMSRVILVFTVNLSL